MKTIKMKKVLIALDYDPTAQKVAEVGYSLAKSLGAQAVLLHVINEPVYYSSTEYSPIMGFSGYMNMSPAIQIDSIQGLLEASQQFLEKSKEHLGDDTVQTMVEEGDFADSIIRAASKVHADVIAIGSHSRKWLEKIVMGSVTEQVLNHSSIPLFIIPTKKR
jgi:nucleotide-binding universal stress UspA family protein